MTQHEDGDRRNRYYLGKRMTPATFQAEQDYNVERRRLVNRALHGWGVVQGLRVRSAEGKLHVGPGLALDKAGRELLQARERTLTLDDVCMSDEDRARAAKCDKEQCWLLSVHYAEQCDEKVSAIDPCHCDRDEWEYTRETVVYSLAPIDCGDCDRPHGIVKPLCACSRDDCGRAPVAGDRGPYHCLCEKLAGRADREPEGWCVQRPGLRRALEGEPLACVKLVEQCDKPVFDKDPNDCGPRRLVLGTDLLYDLIRGRDLTRIAKIGWEDWHRRSDKIMPFAELAELFPHRADGLTGLTVTFSGPLQRDTLRADCVAIHVTFKEYRTGWGETFRVPLRRPVYDEATCTMTLVVEPGWVGDEIVSENSAFRAEVGLVEIEVRGDFILDCCGQAVDANAIGLAAPPATGNGAPGGTFRSTFYAGESGHDKWPAPTIPA